MSLLIPMVYAYNNSDRLDLVIPKVVREGVYLSAKENIGINELGAMVKEWLYKDYLICEFLIPYSEGGIEAYFNEVSHVLSTTYEKEGILMKVECREKDWKKHSQYRLK